MASVGEEQQKLSFNQQQADQLERQTEQYKIQTQNLKEFQVSHDKILNIQAKQLQNLVEIGNLTGNLTDKTKAWADSQAALAERYSQTFALQENWFTKSASFLRDIAEAEKNRLEAQKEVEDAIKKFAKDNKAEAKKLESSIQREIKLKKEILEIEKDLKEAKEKDSPLAAELEEKLKNHNELLKSRKEISESINPELANQLRTYEKIADQVENIQSEASKAALFKGIEQAGGLISKGADVYGKVQGIAAQMYKSTGGMTSIIDAAQETFMSAGNLDLAKMGIGFENISEAVVNLSQRSAQFATATLDIQKEVGLTTAKLERLGVSIETSGDLFNTFRLNFGVSASEFDEMADTFVGRAADIGMSVQQYTQDFQSSYPVLSRYGTDAVNVFDKLARQARASGLSVQELAQSMGQFDTFSGAAENASKLNFLLGSQLDTTQLLMADEADRIDMIKNAFSPAQFENMDKFKKKAIAAAAGFSDVGAFEKAMRGDVDALGSLAKTQQEKLDDAVTKSTSAQEAMSKAVENTKDTLVLFAGKMSEQLGTKGQTLYGSTKGLGLALTNLAGITQMASASMALQVGPQIGKSLLKVPSKIRAASGGARGLMGAKNIASAATTSFRAIGGTAMAGITSGLMVTKDAIDVMTSDGPAKKEDIGGVTGGAVGAVIGGAIGSIIPVAGTALGASLGAGIGNMVGNYFGSKMDEEEALTKAKKEENETNKNIERLLEDGNKERAKLVEAEERKKQRDQTQKNWSHVIGTKPIDSTRNMTRS